MEQHGATVTLPRTGCLSKIDDKTRRKLVKEAAKRLMATLKELQELMASTGSVVHVTTISRLLHVSGLRRRLARWKPCLSKKNIQAQPHFAKRQKSPKRMLENVLWFDETKVEGFGHNSKRYIWCKTTLLITKRTPYLQRSMAVVASCFVAGFLQLVDSYPKRVLYLKPKVLQQSISLRACIFMQPGYFFIFPL